MMLSEEVQRLKFLELVQDDPCRNELLEVILSAVFQDHSGVNLISVSKLTVRISNSGAESVC